MSAAEPRSPLRGFWATLPGGGGARPGLVVVDRMEAMTEVIARRGALERTAGLLPAGSLALAPGRWLVPGRLPPEPFAGIAALVEAGSAHVVLRVSGPAVRDILPKLCRLDLDALRPGDTARTPMAQVPVVLHVVDAAAYDLRVPFTLARSFAEALVHAASGHGWSARSAGEPPP